MEGSPDNSEWTIGRLLDWTRGWLTSRGIEQPRLSAELLLAHAVGRKRIDLYTRYESVPQASQVACFRELVRRAGEHTPIAYLIGKKEFYSLEFEVTPAVLIPRPESETLVERVADYCARQGEDGWNCWDLGTGSGCLAVALCKQRPNLRCLATDVSAEAQEVAARNAARHGLADRIRLAAADGFDVAPELAPADGFDLLMSNPPYVADGDLARLAPAVRQYEPRVALSAGPDGLRFYRLIAEQAPRWLRPGGAVFVEIGCGQEELVADILTRDGSFARAGTWRDAPGSHVRVLQFALPTAARPGRSVVRGWQAEGSCRPR